MTRPKVPAWRWFTVSLCYRITTVPYDTCSLMPTGHWGCGAHQCQTLPRKPTKSGRTCPVMPGCQSRARLSSLLFLGPPGLPPQSTPLRRLPLQLSLLPPPPASPALRPPPHPQKPPHQPLNLKSLQVVVVSLQGDGAGGLSGCHFQPLRPQLPSQWAPRSRLRMGSPMQQSSAAAAYKSWNPLLPTDTAPVLAPAPTLEQPLLEHDLPPSASSLSVPGSHNTQL